MTVVAFFSDETINYIPLVGGKSLEMKFLITKRVVMINVFMVFFHFQTYKWIVMIVEEGQYRTIH